MAVSKSGRQGRGWEAGQDSAGVPSEGGGAPRQRRRGVAVGTGVVGEFRLWLLTSPGCLYTHGSWRRRSLGLSHTIDAPVNDTLEEK